MSLERYYPYFDNYYRTLVDMLFAEDPAIKWQSFKTQFDNHACQGELRRKIDVNENISYAYQCVKCGSYLTGVKKITLTDEQKDAAPDYDQELRKYYHEYRWEVYQRNASLQPNRREKYYQYLQTPQWQEKRIKVLNRANGICEGCLENHATEVHHATYDHVGNELLFQLLALCRDCHEHFHSGGKEL